MPRSEQSRRSPDDAVIDVWEETPDAVRRVRERQARVVLDHMFQFVGLLDPDGNLLDANQTALDGAGIRREDITGRPFEHARWWQASREAQAGVREAIRRAARGEFVRYDVDIFGAASGDELITIDFSLVPVRFTPDAEVSYLIAEGRNITEQKLAEAEVARQTAQLQELYERVRALDEVKTDFFANVSHELRTPLALILGPLERLLADESSAAAPYRQDLEVAQRNARTVLKHVNDLLDISKLEAGRMAASYRRSDLATLISRSAGHFDGLAAERGLDLRLDLPPQLPVEVDVEKLERVLLNLLSNAVKFTPDGGTVAVHLRTRGAGTERALAVVSVEDSGPGVPESQREVIFERFRQAEGGAKRRFGGTGLGLAIARDFVQLLGGDIRVGESALGGAAFVVELPLKAPTGVEVADGGEEHDSDALSEMSSPAAGARAMVEELRPERSVARRVVRRQGRPLVLVVEDNPDLNAFIADVVGERYDVAVAGDGAEGLGAALQLRPDLILSDVMMPRMDGAELLSEVRRRPELDGTPFLLLSAKADEDLRVRLLREGAQDHITKPFSPAELIARIDLHLRSARREGGLSALLVLAPDGTLLRGNAALTSVLASATAGGAIGAAAPGRPDLFAALHADSARSLSEALHEMREGSRDPVRLTVRLNAGEQAERQLLLVAVPVHDPAGRLRHVTGSLVDITEQQLTAVAPLHAALAAAHVGTWVEDGYGSVTWSVEQRHILGVAQEAPASRELLTSVTVPEDRDLVASEVQRCREAHGSLVTEFRVVRPDGSERRLLSVAQAGGAGSGAAGEAAAAVRGILTDVTEQRQAERARAELAHKDRLAGLRAHELQRATAALSQAVTAEDVVAVLDQRVAALLDVRLSAVLLHDTASGAFQAVARTTAAVREQWQGLGLPLEALDRAGTAATWSVSRDTGDALPWLSLPLHGGHDLRGIWLLGWDAPRRLSAEDLTTLQTLADLAAQALERAQLYENQRDVAQALQKGLLPATLPEVPGIRVAARYQPSARGAEVGGDWYDVIPLPTGRVGLVIGDVEGHSTAAAAVMGQVRNALRAYAIEGHPPAGVLERVNRLLDNLGIEELVSCCYVELSPVDSTATVVLAGHPAPLLVESVGETAVLEVEPNLILGIDPAAVFEETTVLLKPGSTLVLYTDGLTDLPGNGDRDPLDAMLTAAGAVDAAEVVATGGARGGSSDDEGADTDQLVDRLLATRADGCLVDDIALLAVTLPGSGMATVAQDDRRVSRWLPLDPTSAGAARRFVADVLPQWELPDLTDSVSLLVSELVTNAVLHTTGDVEVAMQHLPDRLRVEVSDESERLPAPRSADEEDTGGRGLLILEVLAQDWGIDLRGAGKAVWFEIATGPDVEPVLGRV